ncbi:DUF6245 family protein [Streptomyces sp. NPDC059866]|uniref:DUF6245 family protein n=1 Tax=Streptomyces sp. NPDC059866 TaxID=3346978 RepID=UPI003661B474
MNGTFGGWRSWWREERAGGSERAKKSSSASGLTVSALPGTVQAVSAIADTAWLDDQVWRAAWEGQLRAAGAGLDDLKATAASATGCDRPPIPGVRPRCRR